MGFPARKIETIIIQKKRSVAVSQYDPTRTTHLRNAFVRDLNKRFRALRGIIRRAIIEQDCFGMLDKEHQVTTMAASDFFLPGRKAFAFSRSEEKVNAFMIWLQGQEAKGIIEVGTMQQIGTPIETAWTNKYIKDSYQRGVQRARWEMKRAGYEVSSMSETGGISASMATPFHMDRCFTSPHVRIYTSVGWKKIKDVEIGDLVLTHRGRFRKVSEVHRRSKQMPKTVRIEAGKGQRCITATVGHPVRVGKKWVPIENVRVGDRIEYLAARCRNCGKLIPYENQYCNIDCAREGTQKSRSNRVKSLWKDKAYREKTVKAMKAVFDNGKRDRFEITKKANDVTRDKIKKGIPVGFQAFSQKKKDDVQRKAYAAKKEDILNSRYGFQNKELRDKALQISIPRTKEMIKKGTHPFANPSVRAKALHNASIINKRLAEKGMCGFQRPEVMAKAIKGIARYRRELGKKFARRGAGQTGIERKMQCILDDIGISYVPEYNVGRYIVDFAIPSLNLAIEVDGKYWHQDKEKDDIRQRKIEEKGWDVLRFGEDEINTNIVNVRDKVQRVVCNHAGMYEFMDLEITKTELRDTQTPRMLYNLSVDEDESYIAGGFVVHNCGVLYTRVFQELKGITSQMDTQISRVLSQGIADGKHPTELAKLLTRTISGPVGDLGITDILGRFIPAERRARILARTEITRAHSQGMIQEAKSWAVENVHVIAEWVTAGYKVCPLCAGLEGRTFSLDEAMNLLPYHPNCRCSFIFQKKGERKKVEEMPKTPKEPKGDIKESTVALIERGKGRDGETLYSMPVKHIKTNDWKTKTRIEIKSNGRINLISGPFNPDKEDVRNMIQEEITNKFSPLKKKEYLRFTNTKNEIDLLKSGKLRPSRNWATGMVEEGLSVSKHGGYSLEGYRYGYKIEGEIIGYGSDGEPLLDLGKKIVLTSSRKSSAVLGDWYLKEYQKKAEAFGWNKQFIKAAQSSIIISP